MTDYTVARLSVDQIEKIATETLADCPKLPNGAIDILTALRLPWIRTIHGKRTLRLKLVADELLPINLAQMWAGKERVTITARISLWNSAEKHDAEALRILRHEYSHGVLHFAAPTRGQVTLDRRPEGNKVYDFIDPEKRAEDQADWLEACLAMPRDKISPSGLVRDLIADWNVTISDAQWRLERVRAASPKRIPDTIKRRIETIHAVGCIPDAVQALWDKLEIAPDRSPTTARLARGFLVEYSEYRRYTQTGWDVECGNIIPLILKMQG